MRMNLIDIRKGVHLKPQLQTGCVEADSSMSSVVASRQLVLELHETVVTLHTVLVTPPSQRDRSDNPFKMEAGT
jgi:hypothetical protein